jgi:hypothetical protein
MNQTQQRKINLLNHYDRMAEFYFQVTNEKINQDEAKKLSSKLLKFENLAHQETTAQCNGTSKFDAETDQYLESDLILDGIAANIQKLFKNKLKGLFINYDARGYALKISDKVMKQEKYNISQDWGAYGILSPQID